MNTDQKTYPRRILMRWKLLPVLLCGAMVGTAAAEAANVSITAREVNLRQVADGDTLTVRYQIQSDTTFQAVLGAKLAIDGSPWLLDSANERTVTIQTGTNWYERPFFVNMAPGAVPGSYALEMRVFPVGQEQHVAHSFWVGAIDIRQPLPLTVPVLSYNKIGVEHNWYWISRETFRSHMQALADQGYRTVTLQDLMDYRAGRKQPPAKAVVLTFANGYRHVIQEVDPILAQHGFVATQFLAPHYVGKTNTWDDGDKVPEIPHLTWNEIRTLRATGRWDFQATGNQHTDLRMTNPATEARLAKEAIESQLGNKVIFFSYPWGMGSDDLTIQQSVQRQGYFAAFGFREEVSIHNKWMLPRFDMHKGVHVNPQQQPEEWYLFGSQFLGRGSAQPPPQFEWHGDGGDSPGGEHFHPADTARNWMISINEVTAYGAAWRRGDSWAEGPSPITINYVTRAGFLWRSGGHYRHNPNGGPKPGAWEPAP
jgi:peptidoglycan/xylan/chitin deacetylase (PgdA/CDA1 family)